MRGSIRKHGSGYEIRYDIPSDSDSSSRKQKAKGGFKTKKEAQKALVNVLAKMDRGEYIEEDYITLSKFLDKWLESKKSNLKLTTYNFYYIAIEHCIKPILGSVQLSKLRPMHIQKLIDKCIKNDSMSNTTVRHYFTTLKTALNQAVKWQLIYNNPCNSVEAPRRNNKEMKVLTPNQINTLLNYTKQSDFNVMYIPLLLALMCGLRRGEIIALTWDKVDLINGYIRINENVALRVKGENIITSTKTEAGERDVSLPDFVIRILKDYNKELQDNEKLFKSAYKNNNLVCCWPDGSELKPNYLTHTIKKLLKLCNLPDIRFHDLRHSHATMLLLKGVNSKVVSERLGHANIDITLDLYSHVLPEMQKEAADKINELFKGNSHTKV